ncbi:hypothetical protein QA286_09320 [Glaesserella parasuis]|nr:hypothetical protein [Glaesserella parasuis]MDG6246888.1 hypothetical protein [Glaesserella parasuis]MDG6329670.1 hypothetical protein [Glaesserella parasuis]MDG6875365.1 hypothetical protein [Glaesserella parasuis]MDP0124778.1 hypothetical protein [Glaesserella parasuis]MDP0126866.1 hypothetical protein [Glaesserella parasuis]
MKKKTKPIVLDQFKHFSELTATLEKKRRICPSERCVEYGSQSGVKSEKSKVV